VRSKLASHRARPRVCHPSSRRIPANTTRRDARVRPWDQDRAFHLVSLISAVEDRRHSSVAHATAIAPLVCLRLRGHVPDTVLTEITDEQQLREAQSRGAANAMNWSWRRTTRHLLNQCVYLAPWPGHDAISAMRTLKASGIRIITIARQPHIQTGSACRSIGRLHLPKQDLLFAAFGDGTPPARMRWAF
jgi:hypothetical protein